MRAALTKATFFRHFPGKREVLVAGQDTLSGSGERGPGYGHDGGTPQARRAGSGREPGRRGAPHIPLRSARRTRIATVEITRKSTAIPAATRKARSKPAASACS